MSPRKIGLVRTVLIATTILISLSAQAGMREGLVAYDAADYQKAMAELLPEAEHGNALAQYKVGMMFRSARGVAIDNDAALRWYKLAAAQGHARAQFEIARWYCEWRNPNEDCTEQLHWLQLSAVKGNADAAFLLARLYSKGEKLPQDATLAKTWLTKAAEQGNRSAQMELDLDRAHPGIERGLILFKQLNYPAAILELTPAAASGNTKAQATLGEIYLYGQEPLIKENPKQGRYWLELAAKQNDPNAQLWLGTLAKNSQEKLRWYEKAGEQGNADALLRLANIYDNGQEGVLANHVLAAKYCLQAAINGSTQAQHQMGNRYLDGLGVDQNFGEAARWHLKSAEAGDAYSQSKLGELYLNGQGVKKDIGLARFWYEKAAEQDFIGGYLGLLELPS